MGDLIVSAVSLPGIMFSAGERSAQRFIEFFTAQIRNPNTRGSYAKAATEFFGWCEIRGVRSLDAITPIHVTGWIDEMTGTHSAPTVKQRLVAVRHLFDWLVTGHIMPTNDRRSDDASLDRRMAGLRIWISSKVN